jgi:hypothetical protein
MNDRVQNRRPHFDHYATTAQPFDCIGSTRIATCDLTKIAQLLELHEERLISKALGDDYAA